MFKLKMDCFVAISFAKFAKVKNGRVKILSQAKCSFLLRHVNISNVN